MKPPRTRIMFKLIKNIQIKQFVSVKHKRNFTSLCDLNAQYIIHNKHIKTNFINNNLKLSRTLYLFTNRSHIYAEYTRKTKQITFVSQKCDCHNDNGRRDIPDQDLLRIKGKFPQPKTILHNFYGMVALELNDPTIRISPQYKLHGKNENMQHWKCTYSVKWPEEIKFHKSAASKKEASAKAAWSALLYLQKIGKMTANGFPLVYDSTTVKKLTKENHLTVMLEPFVVDRMKLINNLFEQNIEPAINNERMDNEFLYENNNNNNEDVLSASDEVITDWFADQKVSAKNLKMYLARETVDLPIQNHK